MNNDMDEKLVVQMPPYLLYNYPETILKYCRYSKPEQIGNMDMKIKQRINQYNNNEPISYNEDSKSLSLLFKKMCKYNDSNKKDKVSRKSITIHNSWDCFGPAYIYYLLQLKEKWPNCDIIACIINDPNKKYIYTILERAIILSNISLIDKVLVEPNINYDSNNVLNSWIDADFGKPEFLKI
jgi:hypothetical protein